jgi:hypothetical protein
MESHSQWEPRSRRGQLGVSPDHAETVMRSRNLNTGYISSQYHCVFVDWFETVYSPADVDPEWEEMQLFQGPGRTRPRGQPPG